MFARFLCLAAALSLTWNGWLHAAPPGPESADPPQGVFSEAWMALYLEGQKIGYAHVEQSREDNLIHSKTRTYLLVKRGGFPLEISLTESTTETVQGQPLEFRSETLMAEQPLLLSGTIENGQVTAAGEQFGQKMVQTVLYPQGAVMAWGAYLQTIKQSQEVGTKFSLDTYVPTQALNVSVPVTVEVLGQEKVALLDQEVSAVKTRTTTTINSVDVEAIGWVNEKWEPLRQQLSIMSFTIDMIATDRRTALAEISGAEMFVNTLIPLRRRIDRDRAKSITFKIKPKEGTEPPQFPETALQKVVRSGPDGVLLKVTRQDHRALARSKPAEPPDDLAAYLRPSLFVTSSDPEVRAMARRVSGSETRPYQLADKLRRAVSDFMEFEGLGTGFATAAEVCRNKRGDCTENSVLLAALGRAKGIPTRVVTGLIYVPEFNGKRHVMGFHMWTQFWIDGTWVDLDAAWNQTDVDPTHIALGTHSTEHASMGSLVSAVMLQMDQYQIRVVDLER